MCYTRCKIRKFRINVSFFLMYFPFRSRTERGELVEIPCTGNRNPSLSVDDYSSLHLLPAPPTDRSVRLSVGERRDIQRSLLSRHGFSGVDRDPPDLRNRDGKLETRDNYPRSGSKFETSVLSLSVYREACLRSRLQTPTGFKVRTKIRG